MPIDTLLGTLARMLLLAVVVVIVVFCNVFAPEILEWIHPTPFQNQTTMRVRDGLSIHTFDIVRPDEHRPEVFGLAERK